ncbi:hypothetical protein ACMFMG_005645 [Clarireedia jacksonii]
MVTLPDPKSTDWPGVRRVYWANFQELWEDHLEDEKQKDQFKFCLLLQRLIDVCKKAKGTKPIEALYHDAVLNLRRMGVKKELMSPEWRGYIKDQEDEILKAERKKARKDWEKKKTKEIYLSRPKRRRKEHWPARSLVSPDSDSDISVVKRSHDPPDEITKKVKEWYPSDNPDSKEWHPPPRHVKFKKEDCARSDCSRTFHYVRTTPKPPARPPLKWVYQKVKCEVYGCPGGCGRKYHREWALVEDEDEIKKRDEAVKKKSPPPKPVYFTTG